MKGNNTLVLNTATMIEAMQEYLTKRMGDYAPRVTNVKSSNKSGYSETFDVETEEATP